MDRSILVIYRPREGRLAAQLRGVVEAATDLGVSPVVLLPKGWEAPEVAELAQYCADLGDTASVRAAVARICAEHRIERIFPLFESDVLPASRCRRDQGIPGLMPEEALNFRDKNVMHRRAEELGIRVARSERPDTIGTVARFAELVGYPVVIKPYAGSACIDTYRVDSREDLERVWLEMGDDRSEYRVEEFIRGTEFHVDSLLQNGEVVFEQLSQYSFSVLEYLDEPGGTISRKYGLSDGEQRVLDLNAEVLRGFGLCTGVSHAEFFLLDDGEVVFGEAGARVGGGPIAPAIEAGRGINLAGEWCRLELDPTHRPAARLGPEVGGQYLSSTAYGRITAISTPEELMALDSVVDAEVWKSVGEVLAPPTGSHDALGWYVCEGAGFEDLRNQFKAVRDAFRVKTAQD
ncbi:ATP-grasp domain-containing protein [Streptomyces lydicamycinicus]|uniref:ATP-grasp domain-containing protein n=1 Tax=Streptomyces lydicamycinicus TaxID=1546107 RepID=A0A0P4RGL3_9ACTN|nr:ATP-grasp domain-containing protein [Streptomyces lydicamycinicus]USA00504.1 ATP-grasp domain-containing protein [Streptomyces lydicamycinicus]GAO12430.1 hypothetical protein TPA0598_10_04000 [Streptomyces lydicamycinicus]